MVILSWRGCTQFWRCSCCQDLRNPLFSAIFCKGHHRNAPARSILLTRHRCTRNSVPLNPKDTEWANIRFENYFLCFLDLLQRQMLFSLLLTKHRTVLYVEYLNMLLWGQEEKIFFQCYFDWNIEIYVKINYRGFEEHAKNIYYKFLQTFQFC